MEAEDLGQGQREPIKGAEAAGTRLAAAVEVEVEVLPAGRFCPLGC